MAEFKIIPNYKRITRDPYFFTGIIDEDGDIDIVNLKDVVPGYYLTDIKLDKNEDVLVIPDNVTAITTTISGHFKRIVFPKNLKSLKIEKLIPPISYCSMDTNPLTCEIYDFRKCYEDFRKIFNEDAFYKTLPWSENFQFCIVLFSDIYVFFLNNGFTPIAQTFYPFKDNTFYTEDNEVFPFSPKFEKEISDLFFSRLDIDIIIEIIKHCSKPRELTLYLIEFFRSTDKHEHQIELMNLLKKLPGEIRPWIMRRL